MSRQPFVKSNGDLKQELTALQYSVTREKATERPGTGEYLHNKEDGVYTCVVCGTRLFDSETKYDSGSGWPSFYRTAGEGVGENVDRTHGMVRTEVVCTTCQSHLGHVFNDGPQPTGLRYCINSAALKFSPREAAADGAAVLYEKATFAAGCFWGVEQAFREVKGVVATQVGYTGGTTKDPTYREVCSHTTGHAEAVEVTFDPRVVTYAELLDVFWSIHNPTTPNRQGPDIGSQYRSAIFFHSPEQEKAARDVLFQLTKEKKFRDPIVTQIVPAPTFYRAEEYHQQYFEKNGGGRCAI